MPIDINSDIKRFFGSKSLARNSIQAVLSGAEIVRIAVAYFEPSGFQALQDALTGKQVYLMVGREEGGRDRVEDVINDFVDNLSSYPLHRRTRAMRLMLEALENNMLLVGLDSFQGDGVLMDARYLYHHAKLYIADEDACVVTSANMSHHGLIVSREAGYVVEEPEAVTYFIERFDHYFQQAKPITELLIENLKAYLDAYPPYQVYVRSLLELYGLPEEEVPQQLPQLAGYQRPVVSRVLQSINDHRGAMLIASTGLGKTVMASHVVAYLRMQNRISRVLIICPAGLRETWRRFMRAAVTSSVEFSYHTMSADDPTRDSNVRNLEYELRYLTSDTLIILDESHHLRNPNKSAGVRTTRYERIEDAVHRRDAHLLMLTATPFSRGVGDVNAQLELLPKSQLAAKNILFNDPTWWNVDTSRELPDLPPCVVLTTPSVVHHFSQQDSRGDRYVLFSKDQKRYFPYRLRFHTHVYQNSLDEILVNLLKKKLLNQKTKSHEKAFMRPMFDELDDDDNGHVAGFFNAEVMRQFCSSPAQVLDLFSKLKKPGGYDKMRFANQRALTKYVNQHTHHVERALVPINDEKLQYVIQVIENAGPEKVVIFCYYIATAKYLQSALNDALQDIRVETTADKDVEQVSRLLRDFAPLANDVPVEEQSEGMIDVLIATGALAEGFNMQDASILINFDLPWTVLVLAQRMGRILRPWIEPREITIHNLIPSTMNDKRVHLAMNWQRRLLERNQQHTSFADIPVMLDRNSQTEEGLEMTELAQQLLLFDQDIDLDLEQTMEFIKNAEQLETSTFMDDLSRLSIEDQMIVAQLPPGFRSAKKSPDNRDLLFLLLNYRRRNYAVLFDNDARIVLDDARRDQIMSLIRCVREEPIIQPSHYPSDDMFDAWIDDARLAWSDMNQLSLNEIDIICAMALISAD